MNKPMRKRGDRDKDKKKGFYKRKSRKACEFCIDKELKADYKDVGLMSKYITERGKIKPRRATGCCARHQRKVTAAIMVAREMALIPYTRD